MPTERAESVLLVAPIETRDCPTRGGREAHEDYLVALHDDGSGLRELSYAMPPDAGEYRVDAIHIACSCGWRSPRLRAPSGTVWRPYAITLPPHERVEFCAQPGLATFADRARALWERHCSPASARS